MKFAEWIFAKFGAWLTKEEVPERAYLSDFNRISSEVKPGDVLLVEGRHRVSRIIRHITFSPWTHSALYIGRLKDIKDVKLRELVKKHSSLASESQFLIESVLGKGTIVSPLEKYSSHHMRICRPTGLAAADTQKVLGYVINRLGSKYNTRHIFDLARLLFPWGILPRRWRSSLFQSHALQPTEDICSSIIAMAFDSINFPILPLIRKDEINGLELIHRNPRLFTPSDFDFSPYFAIIKYPIFRLDKPGAYHHLPWVKGIFGDEYGNQYSDSDEKKE